MTISERIPCPPIDSPYKFTSGPVIPYVPILIPPRPAGTHERLAEDGYGMRVPFIVNQFAAGVDHGHGTENALVSEPRPAVYLLPYIFGSRTIRTTEILLLPDGHLRRFVPRSSKRLHVNVASHPGVPLDSRARPQSITKLPPVTRIDFRCSDIDTLTPVTALVVASCRTLYFRT